MKRNDLEKLRTDRGFIDIRATDNLKKSMIFASNARFLFELDDCEIIYKNYSDNENLSISAFNEVLYYRIAKKLGVFSAEYDFAAMGEENGTISYVIKGKTKTIFELSAKKYSSLDSICDAQLSYSELCTLFKRKYKKHAKSLENELLRLIILDALVGHSDKSCTNLLICENEKEVHLFSVDASDLWSGLISLNDRGKELFSFLNSFECDTKKELLDLLYSIDINEEIDMLVKEYPIYAEIGKEVKILANSTKEAILQGENNEIIKDYYLYPKREIKIIKGGKII